MRKKRILAAAVLLAALTAAVYLTGCSEAASFFGTKAKAEAKSAAGEKTEKTGSLKAKEGSAQASETEGQPASRAEETPFPEREGENGEEEEDLYTALFRSGACVVQMEITTGLTTEFLDPLCNYPVKVFVDGGEDTIEDEDDIKRIGLDTLYSEELQAAVKAFDVEKMEIKDGRAVMGDGDHYVVLEMDEYENVGITEFHV